MTVLASVVGGLVAGAAAHAGASECGGSVDVTPGLTTGDAVCSQLVATLSQRVGLVTAAITAIVILTAIGLARLADSGRS